MGILFSSESESHKVFSLETSGQHYNTREDVQVGVEELLKYKNEVTTVILSKNSYGVEATQAIAEALSQCTQLVQADLSDMFVGRLRQEVVQSMSALAHGLLQVHTLEVLDVSDNAFGPDGVNAFRPLLEGNPRLKELKVNNNGLGPEGGQLIAEGLRISGNNHLHVFEACRDRLEDGGAVALAEVFSSMSSLRKVSVYQNGIKDKGMTALLSALRNHP